MTEIPVPVVRPSDFAEFLRIWCETFSQVVSQTAGTSFSCTVQKDKPADIADAGERDLWIVITALGSLRGEMSFRLAPSATLRLGQIFMSEPPAPDAQLTPDHSEAVVELLRQVAGIVCTSAQSVWGEFQLRLEAAASAPSWPPAETFWLHAVEAGTAPILVEIGLSASLAAQLRAQPVETVASQSSAANPSSADASASSQIPATLDLLKDVQLAMTMRFGARMLPLREVLDLSPGTVVELDRRVQDPVDLLLDGQVIARGEVVVVERGYGLRVLEICPPAGTQREHLI
jgi:flagellar motor switch protein FliN